LKGPIRNDPDTAAFFGKPGCWMTYKPATSYVGTYGVEAWVKPGSVSKTYQTIFDTRALHGEYSFDLSLTGSDYSRGQLLHIDVGDGRQWLTDPNGGFNVRFAFKAGRWYYIAATVSRAHHVAVLYVNGRVLGKTTLQYFGRPPLLFGRQHPIAIGGNPRYDLLPGNSLPGNFDGTIGQVAVYDHLLASGTIAAHYNAGRDAHYTAAGGHDDYFNTDSCATGGFCMAVGAYSLNGLWHGQSAMLKAGQWVSEPVPSPSRGVNVFANEVSCASPARCVFVGDHWATQNGPAANLAETWNGSSWRIVIASGPPGTATSGLDDVACPTTRFCMAVGFAGGRRDYQGTAFTSNDGTTWRRLPVPRPRGARNSELGGLACFNAANCMAVGNYTTASGHNLPYAARWHDRRWELLTTPAVPRQRFTTFQGISCPTATSCLAVGTTTDRTRQGFFHAFAEIWTSGQWRVSTLRGLPSYFTGVSCPARNRCFASGATFRRSLTGIAQPLIEPWNGPTWTAQHPHRHGAPRHGDFLEHVSCVTRSRCEAVGFRFNPHVRSSDQTLAEIWNGHHWTVQTTANP